MNEPQPRTGSNPGLVVVLVVLLLGLPCIVGVVLVGGGVMFYWAAERNAVDETMTEAAIEPNRAIPPSEEQLAPSEPGTPTPTATPEPAPPE